LENLFPAQNGHQVNGAIIGMVLGDSSLSRQYKNSDTILQTGHSIDHSDYLEWKKRFVDSYFQGGTVRERLHRGDGGKWKDRMAVHWWTKATKRLNYLQSDFYPRGKKIVKRSILNRLTPLGLAIWFMDDGYIYTDVTPRGTKVFKGIAICTNGFDDESRSRIIQWFDDSLGFHFTKDVRGVIHSDAPSGWRFLSIVAPFVNSIDSMRYKASFLDRVDLERSIAFQSTPDFVKGRLLGQDTSRPVQGYVWQVFPKSALWPEMAKEIVH
jgi:recombination protein RecA